jgi:hypothetical protein
MEDDSAVFVVLVTVILTSRQFNVVVDGQAPVPVPV